MAEIGADTIIDTAIQPTAAVTTTASLRATPSCHLGLAISLVRSEMQMLRCKTSSLLSRDKTRDSIVADKKIILCFSFLFARNPTRRQHR